MGAIYTSYAAITEDTGVCAKSIRRRLSSASYPDWRVIKPIRKLKHVVGVSPYKKIRRTYIVTDESKVTGQFGMFTKVKHLYEEFISAFVNTGIIDEKFIVGLDRFNKKAHETI